jgi:hypothetical protein
MAYGTNAPFGMKPSVYLNNAAWNGQTGTYFIKSGYATAVAANGGLFIGDPVTLANDGTIILAVAGAGNAIIGSFQGCQYVDTNGNQIYSRYWPNSTATFGAANATAFVADDPNILFDVQYNATPGLDFTALNNNAILVQGNGNVQSGNSGWSFGTAAAANPTYQLKIIRLTPQIGNLFNSQGPGGVFPYNNFLCLINNHIYKGGTGTDGV